MVRVNDARATNPAAVGSKFAALARARAAGLPVPPGFAVEIRAFEERRAGEPIPEELAVELRAAARELGFDAGFAVRSSAASEDLEDGSFAGMYRTLLDVGVDELPSAVERCWEAAGAAPARAYLDRRGDQPGAGLGAGLGLIIQRMVRPRAAGVAFSRNPLRRDGDEVVVEAIAGLGDALASGERTPWRAFVGVGVGQAAGARNGAGVRVEAPLGDGEAPPLDESSWRRVADLARRAERHAGDRAQDIEWALDESSRLWLLQLRPITARGGIAGAPAGAWTRALAVDLWADRVSAFLGDVLLENAPRWDLSAAGRKLGLRAPAPTLALIGGFLYVNVRALEASLAMLPRRFRLAELRELLPPGDGLETLPAPRLGALLRAGAGALWLALAEPTSNPLLCRWLVRRGLRKRRRRIAALRAADETPAARLALVERAAEAFVDLQVANQFPYAFAAASVWLLRSLARAAGHLETGEFLRLLGRGGDNVTVRMEAEFRRLSGDPAGSQSFDGFLARYGCRAPQRDLAARRWAETPDDVRAMLRGSTVFAPEQGGTSDDPLATVAWPARWLLRLVRREARRYLDLREDLRFALDEALWVLRRALLDLGAAYGLDDLLIHLRRAEAADLVAGRLDVDTARQRATARRAEFLTPASAPRYVIDGHPIEGLPESFERGNTLRGIGTSPGRASGRVRIVRDPAHSHLEPGEILVGTHLDPGWTPILSRAAGVIVEEGGLLNHGAIIAREFGIPAVVGVAEATRRLVDGMAVVVDGNLGMVVVEVRSGPTGAAAS